MPISKSLKASPSSIKTLANRETVQRQLWVDVMGGGEFIAKLNLSKNEVKRQEVILELIDTERDYFHDLDTVRTLYIEPLKKLILPRDIATIFANFEILLGISSELLSSFEKRQSENMHISSIGDLFLPVCDYLKMYSTYCGNHPNVHGKIESIRQTKSISKFIDVKIS